MITDRNLTARDVHPLARGWSWSQAGVVVGWLPVEIVSITVIALGAIGLRFYKLGEWSFWVDETYSIRDSLDLARLTLLDSPWYWITHLAIEVGGTSEWSARLPAAIIGALSVPLLYVALRWVAGPLVALLAALLLALSPWHIYWSQNARFYVLLSLLAILALLLFYRSLEVDRPGDLAAACLLFGLATITHPTGILSVVAAAGYIVVLWLLPLERPPGFRRRNLLPLGALAAITTGSILWKIGANPGNWISFVDAANNNPGWLAAVAVYYIGVPVTCLAAVGAIWGCRRGDRLTMLLTLAAIAPFVLILPTSLVAYTASRYLFLSAVPSIVLAACSVAELLNRLPQQARWLSVSVLLILSADLAIENASYYTYQNGNRFDYRSAYRLIEQNRQQADLIIASQRELAPFYLPGASVMPTAEVDFRSLATGGQRVWLVTDVLPKALGVDTMCWVEHNMLLAGNFDVHARARNFVMRVYLFDPDIPERLRGLAGSASPSPACAGAPALGHRPA